MCKRWLSVIIPTYNGSKYIEKALLSIVVQESCNIECLVIDDGSNDGTLSIVESFQKRLPIRLIQTERTGNWVVNTNKAIQEAAGKYISFLHQDDIWSSNRLHVYKIMCQKYPDIDLFIGPVKFLDQNGKVVGVWRCPFGRYEKDLYPKELFERLLIQNFIGIPAPFFKKSLVERQGDLRKDLWYTADWDFWLRIARSARVRYLPEPLAAFRIHSASQTVTGSMDILLWQQQLMDVIEEHISYVEDSGRKARLYRVALFSIQLNTFLAARMHGERGRGVHLIKAFRKLSLSEKKQFFQDSRIFERVFARLRAGIV